MKHAQELASSKLAKYVTTVGSDHGVHSLFGSILIYSFLNQI